MNKKILITGVNGQDGSYLSEFLTSKGNKVIGIDMQEKSLLPEIEYFQGSVSDVVFFAELILSIEPDEIYNLASVSQVSTSFLVPDETFTVNLIPVVMMLRLIQAKSKKTRFLQAVSSEIFGGMSNPPFNENSTMEPLSPYAVSKEAAYHMVKLFRKAYNIFASNVILFNHTSPRHSPDFVIPKIIKGLVEVKLGKRKKLKLGNLDIERDWGFAGDYIEAMVAVMRHTEAGDFVVGTGKHLSLRFIVEYVSKRLGFDDYNAVIEIDRNLFRPNDPRIIYSNPRKIMDTLGWAAKTPFDKILEKMIERELKEQTEHIIHEEAI